jgi:hypothetical protein
MKQSLTPIADLVDDAAEAAPTLKQALRSDGISRDEHSALVAERKAIAEKGGRPPAVRPVRDILLQKGYDAATRLLPKVAARLEKAIDDEKDALHERAIDIVSKRVLPIAFFEAMGKSEFKTEEEGGAKPNFIINISTGGQPVKIDSIEAVDVDFKELK